MNYDACLVQGIFGDAAEPSAQDARGEVQPPDNSNTLPSYSEQRADLYPGIRQGESVRAYEKRMGTADTPVMFSARNGDNTDSVKPTSVGRFGPVYTHLTGRFKGALNLIRRLRNGEVRGALSHPDVPGPISVVWGDEGTSSANYEDGFGVAKIDKKHPGDLDSLLSVWDKMKGNPKIGSDKQIVLAGEGHIAVVQKGWNDQGPHWLLTFYKKEKSPAVRQTAGVPESAKRRGDGTSPSAERSQNDITLSARRQPNLNAQDQADARTVGKLSQQAVEASQNLEAEKGRRKAEVGGVRAACDTRAKPQIALGGAT